MANNKIKQNFLYNVGYQLLIVITPLITSPYVSRVLGAHNLGVYSYSYSIAEYFVLFAMLGTKNYGNRQVAMVRDNKENLSETFWSIYFFQLVTSLTMLVIYYMYIIAICKENMNIAFLQGLYVLTAVVDISWFFFGMEEFKITVTRNTIIKLVSVFCIFAFVKKRSDLWLYTFILAGSMFAGYISVFPFLKKYVHFVKPTWKGIKKHIRPNLLLFVPVIAVSIFNVMDKIMLGWMSDYVQVGLYGNTEKLMRIPLGIITALGTVMMPHMAHMVAAGNAEKSKVVIERSMIFIMCMGSALAAGLAGIGRVFAPIFFGEEFVDCGRLIVFLSPTVLSLSWANVIRMQYLIPNKMDTEFIISTIIGAIVNLVVNWLLIPKFGALGAVFGTLCAETSLTVYQTYVVRKLLPITKYLRETVPFVVIGIIMGFAVNVVGNMMNPGISVLFVQVFTGVLIYFSLTLIYISMSKENSIIDFRKLIFNTIRHSLRWRKKRR